MQAALAILVRGVAEPAHEPPQRSATAWTKSSRLAGLVLSPCSAGMVARVLMTGLPAHGSHISTLEAWARSDSHKLSQIGQAQVQSCCSSSQSAAQLRSRLEVQTLILEHTTAEHCTSLVTGKAQTGAGCRSKALISTMPHAEADLTWHGQVWGRAQPAPSAGGRPGCQGRGGCGHRCQQRHAEPARSHRRCPTAHRPMNRGHTWCTQDVGWSAAGRRTAYLHVPCLMGSSGSAGQRLVMSGLLEYSADSRQGLQLQPEVALR